MFNTNLHHETNRVFYHYSASMPPRARFDNRFRLILYHKDILECVDYTQKYIFDLLYPQDSGGHKARYVSLKVSLDIFDKILKTGWRQS